MVFKIWKILYHVCVMMWNSIVTELAL